MTLEELARARSFAAPLAVPEWTLGCFHRRCITYFTGAEDTTTTVIWLQSHGLTADIRIPARRPGVAGRGSLGDCTAAELAELAKADGFIARTAWADDHMAWDTFAAFQPYTRWPEPGRLERVGSALIEWAPSGAYVEDWRLQPGSGGLCAGLSLVSETDAAGSARPREGGLVVNGVHALQVIGRREALPPGRASDKIAEAGADRVFDCSIVYALDGAIAYSIDPVLVGQTLPALDGFEPGDAPDLLRQSGPAGSPWRERLWRIDTLLPDLQVGVATPVTGPGREWLDAEWDVLEP